MVNTRFGSKIVRVFIEPLSVALETPHPSLPTWDIAELAEYLLKMPTLSLVIANHVAGTWADTSYSVIIWSRDELCSGFTPCHSALDEVSALLVGQTVLITKLYRQMVPTLIDIRISLSMVKFLLPKEKDKVEEIPKEWLSKFVWQELLDEVW